MKQKPTQNPLMRWVGVATAVLSLVAGLYQVTHLLSDARERERHVAELTRVGKTQQTSADYEQAWATFEQAAASAESGGLFAKLTGQLGKGRHQVRDAQEDLAMAWLENVRVPEGQTFSNIVDRTVPVLERGITSASGRRKADLLAHVGWAYFLKSRDGRAQLDPEQWYRQALDADPTNPYAHAYRGHWTWRGAAPDAARQDFSAAVAAGRARPHVRAIQLAALRNYRSDKSQEETLRVVNEMRMNGEPIDPGARRDVYFIFHSAFSNDDRLKRVVSAVPATEQLATLETLFGAESDEGSRRMQQAFRAILLEAAGQPADALRTWQTVRSELPAGGAGTLVARADAAIERLSRREARP